MLSQKIDSFFYKLRLRKTLKNLKQLGENCEIHYLTSIFCSNRLSLGSDIYIGPNAEINALGGIEIKNGVIIGPNLIIHSANHRFRNAKSIPYDEFFEFKKVIINENVWIGGNVIITPGSEIGEGCIIGAGTVISGKIPPLSIVVGNPCKVIKSRDKEEYHKLKEEDKIYLRLKSQNHLLPQVNNGYTE